MDKFNEPGFDPHPEERDDLEPDVEFMDEEGFIEHCLDLFDVIKHGSRKQRKHAARELVSLAACAMGELVDAENKLQQIENVRAAMFDKDVQGNQDSPWNQPATGCSPVPAERGPDPSHLYTTGDQSAATCVINEHAHGDDNHDHNVGNRTEKSDDSTNWVHSDPMVDSKLQTSETPASG